MIIVLTAFFVTSCNKDYVNEHAGTYVGVYSIVGDTITIEDSLRFSSGITKDENLYLFGTLLTKESDSKYTSNGKILSSIIGTITGMSTEEDIAKIGAANATFTFSNSQVSMELKCRLLGMPRDTNFVFSGTKK